MNSLTSSTEAYCIYLSVLYVELPVPLSPLPLLSLNPIPDTFAPPLPLCSLAPSPPARHLEPSHDCQTSCTAVVICVPSWHCHVDKAGAPSHTGRPWCGDTPCTANPSSSPPFCPARLLAVQPPIGSHCPWACIPACLRASRPQQHLPQCLPYSRVGLASQRLLQGGAEGQDGGGGGWRGVKQLPRRHSSCQ